MIKIINCALLLISIILCSACTPPGYGVILKTDLQDQAIIQIKQALLGKGFDEVEVPRSHGLIDRYKKRLEGVKRTFSNRNTEYWIVIDVWQKLPDANIEVEIYNVYVGNNPEVRPILNEAANSIESALKKVIPNISIQRTENVIAVPII